MEHDTWRREKQRLHTVIFEADTRAGRAFDIILIISIILSIVVVMLDSVGRYRILYGIWLYRLEWLFTILFTIEYFLRVASVQKASGYLFSFYGLVDLLAILPTYISILLPGGQYFAVIRVLRVLRVFRVLKITKYVIEMEQLRRALRSSSRKIAVFIFAVITITVIVGSLMYVIEGEEHGFTSIPVGIYWAIVTMTTVGYGDIAPQTGLGQLLSAFIMILGYGIIAVPTGIVSVELARSSQRRVTTQFCPNCSKDGHDTDAVFCKYCGKRLNNQ